MRGWSVREFVKIMAYSPRRSQSARARAIGSLGVNRDRTSTPKTRKGNHGNARTRGMPVTRQVGWPYYRFRRNILIPCFGRREVVPCGSIGCSDCTVSRNLGTIVARIRVISILAKALPMQKCGPPPKGKYA
jgi:hypothetical protein